MKNFKSPVRLETKKDPHPGHVIREAISIAIRLNTEVVFEMDGVEFRVTPSSDEKGVFVKFFKK